MSAINDGGMAFPMAYACESEKHRGMSLRDWFAGQALSGLLASGHFTFPNDEEENDGAWMTTHHFYDDDGNENFPVKSKFDFPEAAWRCADAMIDARKEES